MMAWQSALELAMTSHRAHELAIHTVAARTTDAPVHVPGVLRCADERTLSTTLSAAAVEFVLDYLVAAGTRVRCGDLIATSTSPHAGLLCDHERSMGHLLEAQLADARRGMAANEDEATRLGVVAATQRLEQSRAKLLAHEGARDGIEHRSPIDGVVVELRRTAGAASRVVQVARVVSVDPLYVDVPVPFGQAMPTPGTPCEVSVGATRHAARVRALAAVADSSGLPIVEVEVPNSDGELAVGLAVCVRVDVGSRPAVFVPRSAAWVAPTGLIVQVAGAHGFEPRQLCFLGDDIEQPELEVHGILAGERIALDAAACVREVPHASQRRHDR